jgi:hypothetical protein
VTGRRHVAIVAGVVALSGAAWLGTDLAWDDGDQRSREGEQVVNRQGRTGPGRTVDTGAFPPCTPPPGTRDGTYTCSYLGTVPPDR